MLRPSMRVRWAFVLCGALLAAEVAAVAQQVIVVPRRANKSRVRYFDFDWRHVDILVGLDANTLDADRVRADILVDPEKLHLPHSTSTTVATASTTLARGPDITGSTTITPTLQVATAPEALTTSSTRATSLILPDLEALTSSAAALELGSLTGGVRLFFYEAETAAARHAAASIEESYRYLVQQFRYIPERTFPYILYNSYQEFLQTNLFPAQEGLLGVTSTRGDLRLTLPYFGDFQYFRDVSVHEMAHQFTIQKVRSMADRLDVRGDPLDRIPLWFIEGIAEFYAKGGLDDETEMLVRDILLNPDVEEGYAMLDFWADRPGSVLWTYKVGQIRLVFLADTYGTSLVQGILDKSPLLLADVGDTARVANFAELLGHLTKDEPRIIALKFEQWLKKRAFNNYLDVKQSFADVKPLDALADEYVDALNASPSGNVIMYRAYDFVTGTAKLVLADPRAPRDDRTVITDGKPGAESLHPITRRTFDLTDDTLAFVAEADGGDVLYYQRFVHTAVKRTPEPPLPDERLERPSLSTGRPKDPPPTPTEIWDVDLDLGDRRGFALKAHGIYAASSPALSPDGKSVAFIGLGGSGNKDLYVLTPGEDDTYALTQLTDDVYAERDAAWGPGGIVYSSDATATKHHNLFRIDPAATVQRSHRITSAPQDHFDPEVTPEGRVYFTAYDDGSANIYEALPQGTVRRTDVVTGLFALSPGPDGGLWALFHHSGRRQLVKVPKETLTLASVETYKPTSSQPWTIPQSDLSVSVPYDWLTVKNWELGSIFGILGAGSAGVFGQVYASANDRMRNHALVLQLNLFGSFELTDGFLYYLNQESRLTWGLGPFQSLRYRVDTEFQDQIGTFLSFERFFGASGVLRFPFDKFTYAQAELQVGASNFVLGGNEEDYLSDPVRNRTCVVDMVTGACNGGTNFLPEWETLNSPLRFQTELSLSLGYDTIAYNRGTGPIAGHSVLLEGTLSVQPSENEVFGSVRLDAEKYLPLIGRSNLVLRAGGGTTFGGTFKRKFYLSSFDTLRGVPFGNEDFLLGETYMYSTAELQIPLNILVRLLIFSDIEGIVALDFGSVSDDLDAFFDKRVLDFVLGFNFGLGPLVFRLHFAKPINTGVPMANDGSWVTNFSLGWLYF